MVKRKFTLEQNQEMRDMYNLRYENGKRKPLWAFSDNGARRTPNSREVQKLFVYKDMHEKDIADKKDQHIRKQKQKKCTERTKTLARQKEARRRAKKQKQITHSF